MPAIMYQLSSGQWEIQRRAKRQSPRRCHAQGCGNRKPAKGLICSRCQMDRWRRNNPERYAWANLRDHAKERGIPFSLTLEQFTPWARETGYLRARGRRAEMLTVDRIDDDGPYSIENIQVLTNSENARKEQDRRARENEPF